MNPPMSFFSLQSLWPFDFGGLRLAVAFPTGSHQRRDSDPVTARGKRATTPSRKGISMARLSVSYEKSSFSQSHVGTAPLTPQVDQKLLQRSEKQKPRRDARDPESSTARQTVAMQRAVTPSHHRLLQRIIHGQLLYSFAGLVVGVCCIIAGAILVAHGFAGTSSWMAKFAGAESQINDATPGVLLFITGLFVVVMTRYTVSIKE